MNGLTSTFEGRFGSNAKHTVDEIQQKIGHLQNMHLELAVATRSPKWHQLELVLADLCGLVSGILKGSIAQGQPRIRGDILELYEGVSSLLADSNLTPEQVNLKGSYLATYGALMRTAAEYGLSAENQPFPGRTTVPTR